MSARVRLPNPLFALDDRALLTRFADERDQRAFEQLVKRHGGLVFGVCKRAVRDQHLAEDAFQAVFLVLARNPRRAVEASSVGGWLFGVARRVGLTARRHEERRQKRANEQSAIAPHPPETTPNSDFDDILRVLDEELAAMPEELRAALVACFLQERTQDEAARELGWSLSTLRRRLERGKELLRTRLARRGVTLAVGLLTGAIASPARAAVPSLAVSPSATSTVLAAEAFGRGISVKLLAGITGLVLTLVLGGLAVGLADDSRDKAPQVKADLKPILAPAPRVVETKSWVTLTGRVVFPKDRELPKPELVEQPIRNQEALKPFLPLRYERTIIDPETRGIANVVVVLRPDSEDLKTEFPTDRIHPDLANAKPIDRDVFVTAGQFTPRITIARAGDRLVFSNKLPVPTDIHYSSALPADADRDFNLLLARDATHTTKPLPAKQLIDHYTSAIHPWMHGLVWSFEHPYFSITAANGRFEIPNAPAGTWRLAVWHEVTGWLGGAKGRIGTKITIPETRTGKIELDPLTFDSSKWPE